jgi:hypothetical protein
MLVNPNIGADQTFLSWSSNTIE